MIWYKNTRAFLLTKKKTTYYLTLFVDRSHSLGGKSEIYDTHDIRVYYNQGYQRIFRQIANRHNYQ